MSKKVTNIDVGNQVKQVSLAGNPTHNFLVAAGKVKQVVNVDLYSEVSLSKTEDNLVSTSSPTKDALRGRAGLFWQKKKNSLPQIDAQSLKKKAAFSIAVDPHVDSLEEDEDNEDIFFETSQRIVLTANKDFYKFKPGNPIIKSSTYNPDYWKAFLIGVPALPPAPPPSPVKPPEAPKTPVKVDVPKNVQAKPTKYVLNYKIEDKEDHVVAYQARKQTNFELQNLQAAKTTTTAQQTVQQQVFTAVPLQVNTVDRAVGIVNLNSIQATTNAGVRNLQLEQKATAAKNQLIVAANKNISDLANVQLREVVRNTGIKVSIPPKTTPPVFQNIEGVIKPGRVYSDHAFELNVPFEKKTLDALGAPIGSVFIDSQPVYNFFIENYENGLNNGNIKEQMLPNMYVFCTELQNENKDAKNTIFKQHLTLAGHIPDTFVDVTNNKGEKIGEKDKGQYFEKYVRAYGELMRLGPNDEHRLRKKFTTLVTPVENLDLFKEFNEKRELFPMYWDISFSTDNSTQFAQVLEDSQLSSVLMKDIIEGNIPVEPFEAHTALADSGQINRIVQRHVVSGSTTLRAWDLIEWIKDVAEKPIGSFQNLQDGVFLGPLSEQIQINSNPQFDLYKNLLVIIFLGKVKEIISRHLRNFADIAAGRVAYSENLFYRIEKRDSQTNELIQNFYLPNSNRVDILRFIDTQVKYNKKYTYRIYVYQMVLGNKYNYQVGTVSDDTAQVYFINSPSIKLVEVLFHQFEGRIMDSPPVCPEIDMIPFRGVNNQILFNINSAVGEYRLEPILIESTDEAIIRQLREAQRVSEREFLEFKSDDHAAAFEVFRITKKPRSYRDFTGNRIALVKTDIDSITVQKATAASFIDNVVPNKKYYYIFRAIDNHGHISNPTVVYEVEIVDADGTIFPVIQTVEFETVQDKKSLFKTFKRLIKITPAFNQKIINEPKSGLIVEGQRIDSALDKQKVHLGVADEQVWGKAFKVRLTSKRTGKKIDLNFQFTHNHIKRTE